MTELISKIQYKDFEEGEFVESKKRDYEETIDLIEKFPWEKQREKIVIDLTNPSITIEGVNNDFLKLAIFFNGKFVLHYINNEQTLFAKSFSDLKGTYKYLNSYFLSTFDTTDFKEENTWLQHNLKHFVSQDFNYTLTAKSVRKFLLSTSWVSFAFTIFIILLFSIKGSNNISGSGMFIIVLTTFFMGGGLNLILFFNYYLFVKDKILIMSKGNDVFYYGDEAAPIKYDKKQILQLTRIESSSYRNPINGFAIIEIEFKDGGVIKIPNILVDSYALERKLFAYKQNKKTQFPFLRS